ncbi:exodeoxyribonuclease 7 large subunit [Actinorhabdospora filicis]|uniref:Exodeoxyribonuclease 7 large subunit n=1 Tax=Actinorhabdospora filicis TaxID=1785913 RepID=A0A9W6SI01_9ACTN|nr:exodeoxyribonuclease VII large subunit [Actinorhabdospora filicis]GLZ76348.1 exodeoxyribonuclease 7 large subunit [Actinorhabdospora filicis]
MTEAPTPETPWPVRVVSQKIGEWIGRLGWVWAEGEIAQITKRPGSPLVFITLRDMSADISVTVTVPRRRVEDADPPLQQGGRVVVHGKPQWYAGRGTLSLGADEIRAVGLGELLARLQRLKKALAAEGLFDPARKRPLPFLPRRIGLVTGRASAAEKDVLENARQRFPAADFEVVNVPVQGASAVPAVLEALKRLDADPEIEVIILARGGGSVEDLLPWSDEALCRAVFACVTPVVAAIGHETDNPLVDYVADVRASTPTDAAKRVVPDFGEELRALNTARHRLDRAMSGLLEREQHRLDAVRSRPCLAQPMAMVDSRQSDVAEGRRRARQALSTRLDAAADGLTHVRARLRALSPQSTLDRGYAIVQRADGSVLRAAGEAEPGEVLRLRLARGEINATVKE